MAKITNASTLSNWTKVTGTNSVTDGTLLDWSLPFIQITGDGASTNEAYIEYDLGNNNSEILVRMVVEFGYTSPANTVVFDSPTTSKAVNAVNADWYLLKLVDPNNLTSAGLSFLDSASGQFNLVTANNVGTLADGYTSVRITECIYEIIFTYSSAAGTGFACVGGSVPTRSISKVNLTNNQKTVRKIRIGVLKSTQNHMFSGSLYIHEVDVWDARPTEAVEIHETANSKYFLGTPSVVDITADSGQTITAISLTQPDGTIQSLTPLQTTGSRSDAKAIDYELIDTVTFNVADGTYDGFLVEPTAAPCSLFSSAQIIDQVQSGTTAYLVGLTSWIRIESTVFNFGGGESVLATPLTYDLYNWKEVTTGVYRIGIPGSLIQTGTHVLTVTFNVGPTSSVSFVSINPLQLTVNTSHQAGTGKNLTVGYDDGISNNASQHRLVYSGRTIRPYISIIMGTPGTTMRVWRMFENAAGWKIANHLWTATGLNSYSYAVGLVWIRRSRFSMIAQGGKPWMFVAPGGNFTPLSGGTFQNMVDAILDLYHFARGSSAQATNSLPYANTGTISSVSIGNQQALTSTAVNVPGTIPGLFAGSIFVTAATDVLFGLQFHSIGTATTSSTITSSATINDILDESEDVQLWPLRTAKTFLLGLPTITNVLDVVLVTNATISWTTDRPCSGLVNYGTTIGYGTIKTGSNNTTSHSVVLTNLNESTYYYEVSSTDDDSQTVTATGTFVIEIEADAMYTPSDDIIYTPSGALETTGRDQGSYGLFGQDIVLDSQYITNRDDGSYSELGQDLIEITASGMTHITDRTEGSYGVFGAKSIVSENTVISERTDASYGSGTASEIIQYTATGAIVYSRRTDGSYGSK